LVWANGDCYEGEFKDDKPNGYGKMVSKKGKVVYEGHWEDGGQKGLGKVQVRGKEGKEGFFTGNGMPDIEELDEGGKGSQ